MFHICRCTRKWKKHDDCCSGILVPPGLQKDQVQRQKGLFSGFSTNRLQILVVCPSKKGVLALAKRLRAAVPKTVVVVSELMKDELQSGRDEDGLTLRQQAIKCMEERAARHDEDAKDWQEAVYLQSRHDAGFILTDDDSDTRGARLAEAEDNVLEYQRVIVTTPASALCGRLKDIQFW